MARIAELLEELEQEAIATRRVLERIPEDKLDWKPHERSMTLGQLALHIAGLPGAIAELATRPQFDIKTPVPRPQPVSKADVLASLDKSLERARASLKSMDDAALASRSRPDFSTYARRIRWAHSYGQPSTFEILRSPIAIR